jgi:hypothetical protein
MRNSWRLNLTCVPMRPRANATPSCEYLRD